MPAFLNMYIYIYFVFFCFFLECINQLEIQRTESICAVAEQESDLKSIRVRLFFIEVLCAFPIADSLLSPPRSHLQDRHLIKAFSRL